MAAGESFLRDAEGTGSGVGVHGPVNTRSRLMHAADATTASGVYGHISTWDTSPITDMSFLFCGDSRSYYASYGCNVQRACTSAPSTFAKARLAEALRAEFI